MTVEQNQRGEVRTSDTAPALSTGGGIPGQGCVVVMVPRSVAVRGRPGQGRVPELGEPDVANTLHASHGGQRDMVILGAETAATLSTNSRSSGGSNPIPDSFVVGFQPWQDPISDEELSPCLGAGAGAGAVAVGWEVRRLTPLERERLMGWPDGFTAWGIGAGGERVEMSDTTRERLTGNGVVSHCSEWIGRRIIAAESGYRQRWVEGMA